MTALDARGLGKQYGRRWALTDCTLEIPEGRVVGLVGPNGAGKSTLLNLAVGLLAPTTGSITVRGGAPADGPGQLALTLAVAKRPELLILDEPVASLDPLARREFLQALMEVVADSGVSVVLSSHLVTDLERVCDYLVVLAASRVQIAGDVDGLLASHHRLIGPRREPDQMPTGQEIIEASHTDRQSTLIVRTDGPVLDPVWMVEQLSLEDLVLAYMSRASQTARTRRPVLEAQP